MRRSWFSVIYTVIGIIVAITHGYLVLTSISAVLSFFLVIILWPLVLLGFNLHLSLGF